MKVIERYIAKTIIVHTILVMLVVLGLVFFINLVGELKDIGSGDYGFSQAIIHAFLMMPYHLYQFSPMLILLGGMMGLGLLASQQELMVIRTSGVSMGKLMRAVSLAAILLIVVIAILGELVAPSANFVASKRKQSAENNGQAVATASGVWIHEGNNFLHIDRVIGHHQLEGVTRYEFNAEHQMLAAYYVNSLRFQDGQWELSEGVKTIFKEEKTVTERLPKTWDLALNPSLISVGFVEPEQMSLPRLSAYSEHLSRNGTQATAFQFEFWKRIFQPLGTLMMLLLALPFVLGAPRSAMGWRILLGVIVGFSFYIMNALLGQVCIVYQWPPLIAALLPSLLLSLGVAGWALRF